MAAHASRCTRSKEPPPIQSSTRARSIAMTDASFRFVCLVVSNTDRAPRTSGHNEAVPFRYRSGCILSFRLGTIVREARMHPDLPHASPPSTSSRPRECVREYVLKRTSPALPTLRLRNPPWFAGIGFPDRVVGVPWVSNPRRTSSAVFAVLSFGRTTSIPHLAPFDGFHEAQGSDSKGLSTRVDQEHQGHRGPNPRFRRPFRKGTPTGTSATGAAFSRPVFDLAGAHEAAGESPRHGRTKQKDHPCGGIGGVCKQPEETYVVVEQE